MERKGKLEDLDRSFDIEFWQRQGSAAIFAAAWELVNLPCSIGASLSMNSDFNELLKAFNDCQV